jgi:hypothetical protein
LEDKVLQRMLSIFDGSVNKKGNTKICEMHCAALGLDL